MQESPESIKKESVEQRKESDACGQAEDEKLSIKVSTEIMDVLETARFKFKLKLPKHKRKEVTKSWFYEFALGTVATQCTKEGEASMLWRFLLQWAKED